MGMYILTMDGMKVRDFNTYDDAWKFGVRHCKSVPWKVDKLVECGNLPRAEKDSELYTEERAVKNYMFYNGVTVRTV